MSPHKRILGLVQSILFACGLLLASGCVGEIEQSFEPEPDSAPGLVEARVADPNLRLVSTRASGSEVVADLVASFSGWNKQYYRILPGRLANEVAFYNRDDSYVRVMRMGASGGYSSVSTTSVLGQFDEVLRGNFAGTEAPDLLFFRRSDRKAYIYEMNANGMSLVATSTMPRTPLGGTWDVITSGYLGGTHDDLLLYNKTEGVAKFMRWDRFRFTVAKQYWGWKKVWDQIVPGKFNGDVYTDFLFYNQDGTSAGGGVASGEAKTISFGPSFSMSVLSNAQTTWPLSSHAIIVPGEFGGNSATDLLVYDATAKSPDLTTSIWVNNGSGAMSKRSTWAQQKRWTHIVPLQVNGGLSDLLYFTTQRRLTIVPVLVNAASVSTIRADFESSIEAANEAFAPAGVNFELNWTGWRINVPELDLDFTDANENLCTGSADQEWLNSMAEVVQLTYGQDSVVVFVREEGGVGCSDPDKNFVMMPQWSNNNAMQGNRGSATASTSGNPKLLVHELGHHFSLPHSQPDGDFFFGHRNPYDYDADANDDGLFASIYDTPASPSVGTEWTIDFAGQSWCDDNLELSITPFGGASYNLNPERHNIMSRSVNCDGIYRLSPGQVREVRANLWTRREYTSAPDLVSGSFELPRVIGDEDLTTFALRDTNGDGELELVVVEE